MTKSNKYQPNYAVPPAETMLEVLESRGMTLHDFSESSGIETAQLEAIVATTGSIDQHVADELEKATGVVSTFWVNLENNYRNTLERLGKN